MKKLAIIGAGKAACDYAECAREMRVETHCFAWEEGALAKGVADEFHPISILEKDRIAQECAEVGVLGVVATTELTISVAAYVAEKLHLVGNDPGIAAELTDKLRNRRLAASVDGLRQPGFGGASSAEEACALGLRLPVIVKPVDKGGKRGITVVHDESGFADAFSYAEKDAKGSLCIVEEFVSGGMECSVETLSYKGEHFLVQATEKVSSGAPHCVELGHHQPAAIPESTRRRVESTVSLVLSAIGVENGPCHTEIKIVDGEVYLIEVNARPGGDLITRPLVDLSTGYSYYKGAISIAFGEFEGYRRDRSKERFAGVCFVTSYTPELMPALRDCVGEEWFHSRNVVSDDPSPLIHNDSDSTNWFVYVAETRPCLPYVPKVPDIGCR